MPKTTATGWQHSLALRSNGTVCTWGLDNNGQCDAPTGLSVEEHIDPLAERIVALGGMANGTVRQAAARSSLREFPTRRPRG
jgi:alpha-tubulin suppressor-like RCC1 family protein